MAEVKTPVEGFTGVVAGVTFAGGVGTTSDPSALAYFQRHGYKIGEAESAPEKPEGDPGSDPEGGGDKQTDGDPEANEPKGNASLEEWAAYAMQKGIPGEKLDGLKREEIKQLLAE